MTKTPLMRLALASAAVSALVLVSSPSRLQGYATNGHKWANSTVQYYVNPQSQYVSQNVAITAVQTAAAAWNEQTQANIELAYAGTTNGSSLTLNGKNEVFFRNSSNGGNVAETYYWWDGSGQLIDADIIFYEASYQFFYGSGCQQGIYIEAMGVHELGHVLGLNHSDVSGATMVPIMPTYCDRTWLTLETDDINGIHHLYPPSSGGGGGSNTAPAVTITAPGNNASFNEGASITFSGSATDTTDGDLSNGLRWTSNVSGTLGTGASLTRTLPAGAHVITASVTDNGGLTTSRQLNVTVAASVPPPPPPGGASLSARGYKVKGLQKVDLSWSGLSAGSIDVYRNGAHVATTQNTGAATDPINKKGSGSYNYRVCDAGNSAACSATVTVTF